MDRVRRFRSSEAPHEVWAKLEASFLQGFEPSLADRLRYTGTFVEAAIRFRVQMTFEAALEDENCYSIRTECEELAAGARPDGWLNYYLRDFASAPPLAPFEQPDEERYRTLASAAMEEFANLAEVGTIQQRILDGMRSGAKFSTAHKEGGTTIEYKAGKFVRSDYGEWSATDKFTSEEKFLPYLFKFFDHPPHPELLAWRLILRRLGR